MSLPEDVIRDILARVPRWDYPSLSLVSKQFRSVVRSHDLFSTRSLLGLTERCLYVVRFNMETRDKRLYVLVRKTNCARLVLIPSLPAIPFPGSVLAVGSKLYVFGGCYPHWTSSAFIIDCESHTVQTLPDMPVPLVDAKAGFIDGKIYVIGSFNEHEKVIVVFDTERQMWEPNIIKPEMKLCRVMPGFVVMHDKLYISDVGDTCVYEPKENKWTRDEVLSSEAWWRNSCVVDDVLYYYNQYQNYQFEKLIRRYDPKQRCWEAVLGGVDESLFGERNKDEGPKTVNYGGKLALFSEGPWGTGDVWLAEITLERRTKGKLWGKVETIDHVNNVTGERFGFGKILCVVI